MELTFRYKKITLLKWECRKRFKVTLMPFSYSLTTGRCISKRPQLLAQHAQYQIISFLKTYIFCKNIIFRKWSPNMRTIKAHNKSEAHNKTEAPPKISIDKDTEKEQRNSLEFNFFFFFCDFKMSLFKLKSPGFLNKKIYTLQIFKNSG